jgi:hypothetical protein
MDADSSDSIRQLSAKSGHSAQTKTAIPKDCRSIENGPACLLARLYRMMVSIITSYQYHFLQQMK